MASEQSLEKAAQAWCTPTTSHIVMDTKLAVAFAEIIDAVKSGQTWPLSSFDACDWAKEFCRIAATKGLEIDEGWMIGWFANAMMRGYDEGFKRAIREYEQMKSQPFDK